MSFRIALDAESVLAAAAAVRPISGRVDGAPGGPALALVAAAVPGGELADAAAQEAGEWGREMAEVGAALERWAAAVDTAVAAHRRLDAAGVAALHARP